MQTLSFRTIFQNYGKEFVLYLKSNIWNQKGIDDKAFVPSKGSVTGGKRSKKVGKTGTHPRLIVSGKLSKNGFIFSATDDMLKLKGNDDAYNKRGTSYSDILFYNNRPTSANINSPLVFPTNDAEVNMTEPYKAMLKDMNVELVTYFDNVAGIDLKATLKIG